MAETLAFAAEGRVKADIELEPLSAINGIFSRLKEGKVAGRVVIDFIGAPEARATKPSSAEIREAVPA